MQQYYCMRIKPLDGNTGLEFNIKFYDEAY